VRVVEHNLEAPCPTSAPSTRSSRVSRSITCRTREAETLCRDPCRPDPGGVFLQPRACRTRQPGLTPTVSPGGRHHGGRRGPVQPMRPGGPATPMVAANWVSRTWTATGNGSSWRCWEGTPPRTPALMRRVSQSIEVCFCRTYDGPGRTWCWTSAASGKSSRSSPPGGRPRRTWRGGEGWRGC